MAWLGDDLGQFVLSRFAARGVTINSKTGSGMGSYSRALKGTAATAELWGAVYLMLAFALGERSFHAWQRLGGMPVNWQDGLVVGVHLLVCPVPLLIGICFQRLLKQEEKRSQLHPQTYRRCSFWIAQMLLLAYATMVL
jgi:hypothetical protein